MSLQFLDVIGRDILPDLSLDPNAFQCFKLPIITKYRITNKTEIVYNPENPIKKGGQIAIKGSVILTGVCNEEWPMDPNIFYKTYKIKKSLNNLAGYDGNGLCEKKKIIVYAIRLLKETKVRISWDNALLVGHSGDYLVQYEVGEYGIVQKEIFNKTYAVV